MQIQYVQGDLFKLLPYTTATQKFICHVCNNIGGWQRVCRAPRPQVGADPASLPGLVPGNLPRWELQGLPARRVAARQRAAIQRTDRRNLRLQHDRTERRRGTGKPEADPVRRAGEVHG